MNTVKTVRTPTYLAEELNRWRAFSRKYEQKHGHEPTDEEIVAHHKPPAGRKRLLLRLYHAMAPGSATVSLDLLFESTDTVVDPRAERPDVVDFMGWEKERVAHELSRLPEREARILTMRFGLGENENEMTLRQIGKALGISRERVRQLEHEAIQRLRVALDGDRRDERRGPPRARGAGGADGRRRARS
jgi:RNA polymerase primary sigma factor